MSLGLGTSSADKSLALGLELGPTLPSAPASGCGAGGAGFGGGGGIEEDEVGSARPATSAADDVAWDSASDRSSGGEGLGGGGGGMHEEEVGFGGRGGGGGMEVVEEEGLGFRGGGGGMEGSMAAAAERREERETAARRSRNGQGNGRPDGVKPWMGGGGELVSALPSRNLDRRSCYFFDVRFYPKNNKFQ